MLQVLLDTQVFSWVAREREDGRMHLVPAERAHRRIIDAGRVCEAIAAIGPPPAVHPWAGRFALLADPGRLAILLAIRAVPGICVSDLAAATGMNDAAVSQALRLLRAADVVEASKDGRIMRYRLTDHTIASLLGQIATPSAATPSPP